MPITHDDELTTVPTGVLRSVATTCFRHKGVTRMDRQQLASFLLEEMATEEMGLFAGLQRRSRGHPQLADPHQQLTVKQKMRKRYDHTLLNCYLASSVRAGHVDLQRYLSTPARLEDEPASPVSSPEVIVAVEEDGMNNLEDCPDWPQPIPLEFRKECLRRFRVGTQIGPGPVCAICARRSFDRDTLFTPHSVQCQRVDAKSLDLRLLEISDPHLSERPARHFQYGHRLLSGLALEPQGIHIEKESVQLDVCDNCLSYLRRKRPSLPPLALANGNLRGTLPEDLRDCTWLEERLCARYLASAYIVRLYDVSKPGDPSERQRVMRGHSCAFPLNTVSTATKLPWALDEGSPVISCLVIGPRPPRAEDLRNVFKVRRKKVLGLLHYLRQHFKDYPQFPIDLDALNQLPEDDVPELIMRNLVFREHGNVPSLFESETSGLEPHLGLTAAETGPEAGSTLLEHHALMDLNGTTIPGHARMAAALANATGNMRPDIVIKHGTSFIQDYNNPALFPGMFPMLFPWGVGGFESSRSVTLSLDRQASHLLDLADSSFRRHWSYVFVVANIKHRRAIHLGTRLACKKQDFERISRTLQTVDLDLVRNVSQLLSEGGSMRTLNPEESKVFTLLQKCELISAKVPGSKAMMNLARADIRSYIGEFGIFQLFLTLNPTPLHSPVFHVFYGDTSIRLDIPAPPLPNASVRAIRVADDPCAATDYFHFHVHSILKFLFGWDFQKRTSSEEGGILGHLEAFFMVKEHTMRGQLHGHTLVWLRGGLIPSDLRDRLKSNAEFCKRYLAFFDDLTQHEIPDKEVLRDEAVAKKRKPRQELAPDVADADFDKIFSEDHHLLGEAVQRHSCGTSCYKGGRKDCRFLFPHDIVDQSSFNHEENSIILKVRDSTMNWHNPTLLVATRHNHDLQAVQSGKSGVAAASYITSYATKSDETPANQVSMIQTVFEKMAYTGGDTTRTQTLLSKCVMQFGRERQLHAQQAVTYVRELGDTLQSHPTVPMLSGRLMSTIAERYGSWSTQPPELQEAQDQAQQVGSESDEMDAGGEDDTTLEQTGEDFLPLQDTGKAHQVDDYIHRGSTLAHLNFYDFVKYCKLVPLPRKPNKNHHLLSENHPNSQQKCHRYVEKEPLGLPRAIFHSTPRPDGTDGHGERYCAAMLAHFRPFSADIPLKPDGQTYEETFKTTQFSLNALLVMRNWAAANECEDARDMAKLRRRKREAMRENQDREKVGLINETLGDAVDDLSADVNVGALLASKNRISAEVLPIMATLATSGCFESLLGPRATGSSADGQALSNASLETMLPSVSSATLFDPHQRRIWAKEMAAIESHVRAEMLVPRASSGVLAESLAMNAHQLAPETTTTESIQPNPDAVLPPPTELLHWTDYKPHTLLDLLIKERGLTPSQTLAFTIAARHFFEQLCGIDKAPLRLFMHGEAGTGKTVVVRLFRELLERYGMGKQIMLMAPTGKAARSIGGTTQHSSFALEIRRRGLAEDDAPLLQKDQYSAKRIRYLQATFRDVRWLFLDEVSMTSCETMAEMDQSLRIGTQNPDVAFGGINVIFAGDLCQLPPVAQAALYSTSARASKDQQQRTMAELGRAVWQEVNAVVNFQEQMRMQDPDMAATLSRLRLRMCTAADVDLLNGNVLRDARRPDGVLVHRPGEAIVLTRTNEAVRHINHQKAMRFAQTTGTDFFTCCAIDETASAMTPERRYALLSFNGSNRSKVGLGRLPLFVGMPIVYRGANTSVPLGITNGAFGQVHGWDLREDRWGNMTPRGVIVRFADAGTWSMSKLSDGCLPIVPATSSFKFVDSNGAVEQVKRKQLPIQPGFAMTVHSAQGITSQGPVIVDLRRGGFEAYVSATRATCKKDVLLLAPVTLENLNRPALPAALKKELQRLDQIAERTKLEHNHSSWRVDNGLKRKQGSFPSDSDEPSAQRQRTQ